MQQLLRINLLCGKIGLLATMTQSQACLLTNKVKLIATKLKRSHKESNPDSLTAMACHSHGSTLESDLNEVLEDTVNGLSSLEKQRNSQVGQSGRIVIEDPRRSLEEEEKILDQCHQSLARFDANKSQVEIEQDNRELLNSKAEDREELEMLELSGPRRQESKPSTVSPKTVKFYSMDDPSKDPIVFPENVTTKWHIINYKLVQEHLNHNESGVFSFALWDEVPAPAKSYHSQSLWQLIRADGEIIPEGVSRMYFVNVALPEGRRRWYTVVTVKNGEKEEPIAVDVPPTGNMTCCSQDCTNIWSHLEKLWEQKPWTVEVIYPINTDDTTPILYRRFNDTTVPAEQNTLYVIVGPKSSPAHPDRKSVV